jgi:diguanylate cyclase (GGDEF)-like protein
MVLNSLRVRLPLLASIMTVITACVLSMLTEHVATSRLKQGIGYLLTQRTAQLSDKIDRSMYERYQNIKLNAKMLGDLGMVSHPEQMRNRLDDLTSSYEGYAWIGYAGLDGKVVASSRGLLEGVDISQRPWFAAAARAAFVGDLHSALLLEKKLNEKGQEPLRFLDVAIPVTGENSTFVGVLGAHIDWRRIKSITKSLSIPAHSEVLIVGSNNTVLLGPGDLQDNALPAAIAQNIVNEKSGYLVARWNDGKTYLTGYTRSSGYRDYPGLNWLILERQEVDVAYALAKALSRQLFLWGLSIAGLFGLVAWFAASRISRPLTEITEAAAAIEHGDSRIKIPVMQSYREVTVLSRVLSSLIGQLVQREAQLEHQATHNLLTQLPNRALINALIEQQILSGRHENKKIAVIALGLNGFNTAKNTLGNHAGEDILLATAERLKKLGANATLGHLGKDEFILVLQEHDGALSPATLLAAGIQDTVSQPFLINGMEYSLTPCVGISYFPRDGEDAATVLRNSETALSEARRQGGHRIELYKTELSSLTLERLDLERELRQALAQQQLELHYQPQISLKSGELVGVEALVRWRHPERGLISPGKFIPIAEASGLIIPIGNWVINEACRQAQAWQKQGLPPLRIAVNVSSRQFTEGDVFQQVLNALAKNRVKPTLLKLEITESMLMQDVERSIATMTKLADLGIHIAINDFGTGYSSLSYLGKFPISELKIDQSFVRNMTTHSSEAAVIQAIISLAHNLKLSVIAEGVETAAQFNFLRDSGCNEVQGYYFSMPLQPHQLAALLRARTAMLGAQIMRTGT